MRVCPKCGHVDPPEWKHRRGSYWIDSITWENFQRLHPDLAGQISVNVLVEDEHYFYRINKTRTRVERKAKIDYGRQFDIPMQKIPNKRNSSLVDFRKYWFRLSAQQMHKLDEYTS